MSTYTNQNADKSAALYRNQKIVYKTFICKSNREHDVIFIDTKDTEENEKGRDYTLDELGDLGLELIQVIDFKQDDDRVIKRVAIFIQN